MTMVLQDSGTAANVGKWSSISPNYYSGTALQSGPFGGSDSAYQPANGTSASKAFAAQATMVCGSRFFLPSGGSGRTLFSFSDNTTIQLDLFVATDGTLQVRRNANAGLVLAATAAGTLAYTNRWYKIDFDVTIDPTTGAFNVWVDDVPVTWATGSNSGVNTRQSANSQVTTWSPIAGGGGFKISHIYLLNKLGTRNNARLPGFRCDLVPLASVDTVQGVSSGGGASTVANITDASDATYNEVATGQRDKFNAGTPPTASGNVYCVSVAPRWFTNDAAAATGRVGLTTGGTDLNGTTRALPSGTATDDAQDFFEYDGTSSWTQTTLAALKMWYEKLT